MTGQMGNPDPGQDKEAHVVRQMPQVAFPVLLCPADEDITRRGFPCRGAKQETSQGAVMNIAAIIAVWFSISLRYPLDDFHRHAIRNRTVPLFRPQTKCFKGQEQLQRMAGK